MCFRSGQEVGAVVSAAVTPSRSTAGFGTFEVRHRKARTGHIPRTGEPVEVPPRDVPVFKPSLHLHRRVDRASGVSGLKEPLKVVRER